MGEKANDTPKNNTPKEEMDLKLTLKKAMTDSIKNANVPNIIKLSMQLLGTLDCEIILI